jgi:hypothetical protein
VPTLEDTGTVIVEFAAEGDRYGDEGIREISFLLEELSSSGTLLRPRLEEESILQTKKSGMTRRG